MGQLIPPTYLRCSAGPAGPACPACPACAACAACPGIKVLAIHFLSSIKNRRIARTDMDTTAATTEKKEQKIISMYKKIRSKR